MSPIAKTFNFTRRAMRKLLSEPGEAWLVCRMAWGGSVLAVVASIYSLPRALAIVAGAQPNERQTADANAQQRFARAIDQLLSVDVLFFKPICWKRAAVLPRYLSRSGLATRIIFGVRNETGGVFDGHAWLEANGQPILETM